MSEKTDNMENENYYQPLFNLMSEEHGLTLLEQDMMEIINTVNGMQATQLTALREVVERLRGALELTDKQAIEVYNQAKKKGGNTYAEGYMDGRGDALILISTQPTELSTPPPQQSEGEEVVWSAYCPDCEIGILELLKKGGTVECNHCKVKYKTDFEEHPELGTSQTEYWLTDKIPTP